MSVVEKLLIVQDWDCRIRDIEKELTDIPARKELELARMEDHKKGLAEADLELKARQVDIKKLESEALAHQEKIAKFRQQQFEIKTNKEFKAIDGEIAVVQTAISGLEDKELELMENVEAAKARVAAGRKALAEEEAAVRNDVKTWDDRAIAMQKEVDEFREKRAAAAVDIPPDWLASYERIFQRKDKALVPVDDGICGGCHMQLPPFIIHGARQRTAMVYCTYCGRLVC